MSRFCLGGRFVAHLGFGELYKTQPADERDSLAVSDITYLFTDLMDLDSAL